MSNLLPISSKVAFVPRYGPPPVVEFREVPVPSPGPREVRIAVRAAAVTAGDWRIRSGILPRGFGALRGPVLGFRGPRKGVLGTDAAGVVDQIGSSVTEFAVGDEVVAFPASALGAHAEFLVMKADGRVARKPSKLTFEETAALPFGAMTALDFLERGQVSAGESILINGASGNVGTAAVQLAKHLGAKVTAVCSSKNAALVRSLGADEIIDYTKQDFALGEARFDVIMDTAGNAPYGRVKGVLRPRGRLLTVLGDLPALLVSPFVGRTRGHKVISGPASEKPQDLRKLMEFAERGVLVPVIHETLPFAKIQDAYRIVDSGRKVGSVVVSLSGKSD
jgi:NADPH:quinone reductase-like Zn-dependent oxidoreductase